MATERNNKTIMVSDLDQLPLFSKSVKAFYA
jgi:hypothetical protein